MRRLVLAVGFIVLFALPLAFAGADMPWWLAGYVGLFFAQPARQLADAIERRLTHA